MQTLNPLRPQGAREEVVTLDAAEADGSVAAAGNVLVVDPDESCRSACKAALEQDGLAVDEASGGKQGLEVALAGKHDVLVLAEEMPEVNGIDLLRYFRQHPVHSQATILMLSSNATPETATRLLTAGADDHVSKPVDPQQFRDRVKTALQLKQRQAQAVAAPEPPRPPEPKPRARGRRFGKLLRPLGWLFGA